jgi:hypothetical protein
MYSAFVWGRRALNSGKRRFPARVGALQQMVCRREHQGDLRPAECALPWRLDEYHPPRELRGRAVVRLG